MVRAILERRKVVTRRLSKQWLKRKRGDRLWVRETWQTREVFDQLSPAEVGKRVGKDLLYVADGVLENISGCRDVFVPGKVRPSIFMPRWASRITLECTEDARLERVQDITEEEARAEGVEPWQFDANQPMTSGELGCARPYRGGFAVAWDDINTDWPVLWVRNPEVVRIAFKVVTL
jgi:hypothetical protein